MTIRLLECIHALKVRGYYHYFVFNGIGNNKAVMSVGGLFNKGYDKIEKE
jgi:hypothetical protein